MSKAPTKTFIRMPELPPDTPLPPDLMERLTALADSVNAMADEITEIARKERVKREKEKPDG